MISFDEFFSGLPLTPPFSMLSFFDIILFLDKVVLVAIIPSSSYFKETSIISSSSAFVRSGEIFNRTGFLLPLERFSF